jgi:serine/threonine protein kinase
MQANVLVTSDESAVIADFGLSMIKVDISSRSTAAPITGTKRWMSPERMLGKRLALPVDIYAWGMTVYEVYCIHIQSCSTKNPYPNQHYRFSQDQSLLVPQMKVSFLSLLSGKINDRSGQMSTWLLLWVSWMMFGRLLSILGPRTPNLGPAHFFSKTRP